MAHFFIKNLASNFSSLGFFMDLFVPFSFELGLKPPTLGLTIATAHQIEIQQKIFPPLSQALMLLHVGPGPGLLTFYRFYFEISVWFDAFDRNREQLFSCVYSVLILQILDISDQLLFLKKCAQPGLFFVYFLSFHMTSMEQI